MTTMFWILWFFIAFIIVLVAFTLRKENEEMPRREIPSSSRIDRKDGFRRTDRSYGYFPGSTLDLEFKIIGICLKVHITTCTGKCH